MEPVTKSSNSDTFDLFVKCLLYVVLFPSILGLLFSKYLNRLIQKAQINSKYGINVSAFNKFAICIAILLEAIILAGFSYCMYAVFQTHIVWQTIIYALAINISIVGAVSFFIILIYNNIFIKKYLSEFKHLDIVEIKDTPTKKRDMKKWNTFTFFITNRNFIKKYITQIVSHKNEKLIISGDAGVILNKERAICISPYALSRGTVVFGTTGSGKTNTLELFIEYSINQKQNVIFVNGKGDQGLVKDLQIICKNNDYDLKVWSPNLFLKSDSEFIYNPFKDKSAAFVTSILMEIGRYSTLEETTPGAIYYKNDEMACISLLCKSLLWKQKHKLMDDKQDYSISLDTLFHYSDIEHLSLLLDGDSKRIQLNEISQNIELYKRIRSKAKFKTDDDLKNTRQQLWEIENLNKEIPSDFLSTSDKVTQYLTNEINHLSKEYQKIKSTPLIRNDRDFDNIFEEFVDVNKNDDKLKAMSNIRTTFRNLRDISGDKRIIDSSGETLANIITSKRPTILLFSLDTKAMKIQSAQVARMLIADLKQNDRIIREKNENAKLMCIFDEFGSFATEDIVELQEQGRSFGFEIIYSIQTLSNLTKISQDFATRIIGNCSTYITHRTRDNKAAEEIANLIATNPEFEGTMRHSQGEETGEESVREVQAFIHHPRMIKQIPDHHALVVTIQEGQVTPIKDPVKIDYADTENFISNQNAKHSAIEELTDFFRSEGLSNKEAAKLAYEKSYSLPISHINTMSERPVKAKFLTKDGNSKVQIEISKIQAMSDVEWDEYRASLFKKLYPDKEMNNGWFKNKQTYIEKKLLTKPTS